MTIRRDIGVEIPVFTDACWRASNASNIAELKSRLEGKAVRQSPRTFAIVTPTYLPDLNRCELLAESLDHTNPDIPHYLIVDRRDVHAFKHLASSRRILVESEALLGDWIRRSPTAKSYWLSLKALPVRGWIIQQILKIAAIQAVSEQVLIFCDSDTAFIRRFSYENLLVGGKVGLLDVAFDGHGQWTETARQLLGLSNGDLFSTRNFVGNMICWDRDIVAAMQARISTVGRKDWKLALARKPRFSEYMIYGTFVREFLGYESTVHAPSAVPLVKPSWGLQLLSKEDLDAFFQEIDPRTVAVMIHSKDNIEPARYRSYLEQWWGRRT